MSKFKRPSVAAMASNTKRFLRLHLDTKALSNISRPPLDEEFKPKKPHLPVLMQQNQKLPLVIIGGSL